MAIAEEALADAVNVEFARVREWLRLKLNTGRCSIGLVAELTIHMMCRTIDVFAVYDAIESLERGENSRALTKPATQFEHAPLKGLWHKHYFGARHTAKNIANELQHDGSHLERLLRQHIGEYVTDISGLISHEIVFGSIERRSKRGALTGEWLVFDRTTTGNYYLCLAAHDDGDENIRIKVDRHRALDDGPEVLSLGVTLKN